MMSYLTSSIACGRKLVLLGFLPALLLASCGSSVGLGGSSKSTARIFVKNRTALEVSQATKEVFVEEGFTLLDEANSSLHFQKEGGRAAYLAWGGWGTDTVFIRPTVHVSSAGGGAYLDCDLYIATMNRDKEIEERHPWVAGRSSYRSLLKRVRKRAQETPR